jgi:NTE family protein
MTSARPAPAGTWGERLERVLRRGMTRTLDAEVARALSRGKRVVRIEPTAHELGLLGANFMSPRRRPLLLDAELA